METPRKPCAEWPPASSKGLSSSMVQEARKVSIIVDSGPARQVGADTTVGEVAPARASNGLPVLAALLNNEVVSLCQQVGMNCTIHPLTLADTHGWRVYRWSLTYLLGMAFRETLPGVAFRVRHPIGGGLFCSVMWPATIATHAAAEGTVERVASCMREMVARDLPIERIQISYQDAIDNLSRHRQTDQLHLLKYRNPPQVTLTKCGDYIDMQHEPLVNRTGLLGRFELTPYQMGMVLRLPTREEPDIVPPLNNHAHLFKIYQEHIGWGRILGISTVGQLNEAIAERRAEEIIQTVEALHDKKLSSIADQIASRQARPRLILIAGPSSSGKTTFAKRLLTHLRVNDIRPVMISTDDYFVGDELNPRDADGNLDYEHLEAIDLKRFNHDITLLLAGKPTCLPRFNFATKSREEDEEPTLIEPDQVIVIEGIHALNPDLTREIKRSEKFLIYISALTQLALDYNSRISTTDNRLLRRMVRDHQFRKHPPLATLQRWASVLRGEERWIFPFQHLADAVFNSSLDYELSVIKPYAGALLNEIKPSEPEYAEARRLSGILINFASISAAAVPGDSILREYIGGSQLRY